MFSTVALTPTLTSVVAGSTYTLTATVTSNVGTAPTGMVTFTCVPEVLTLSTMLTLLIVPAGFSLADSAEKWLAPRIGRVLNEGDSAPHPIARPAE